MKKGSLYNSLVKKYRVGMDEMLNQFNQESVKVEYRLNVDPNNLLYIRSGSNFNHSPQIVSILGLNIDNRA